MYEHITQFLCKLLRGYLVVVVLETQWPGLVVSTDLTTIEHLD